VAIVALCGS